MGTSALTGFEELPVLGTEASSVGSDCLLLGGGGEASSWMGPHPSVGEPGYASAAAFSTGSYEPQLPGMTPACGQPEESADRGRVVNGGDGLELAVSLSDVPMQEPDPGTEDTGDSPCDSETWGSALPWGSPLSSLAPSLQTTCAGMPCAPSWSCNWECYLDRDWDCHAAPGPRDPVLWHAETEETVHYPCEPGMASTLGSSAAQTLFPLYRHCPLHPVHPPHGLQEAAAKGCCRKSAAGDEDKAWLHDIGEQEKDNDPQTSHKLVLQEGLCTATPSGNVPEDACYHGTSLDGAAEGLVATGSSYGPSDGPLLLPSETKGAGDRNVAAGLPSGPGPVALSPATPPTGSSTNNEGRAQGTLLERLMAAVSSCRPRERLTQDLEVARWASVSGLTSRSEASPRDHGTPMVTPQGMSKMHAPGTWTGPSFQVHEAQSRDMLVKLVMQKGQGSKAYVQNADGIAWRKYGSKKVAVRRGAVAEREAGPSARESSACDTRVYYLCSDCYASLGRARGSCKRACARKNVFPIRIYGTFNIFLVRYTGSHAHQHHRDLHGPKRRSQWPRKALQEGFESVLWHAHMTKGVERQSIWDEGDSESIMKHLKTRKVCNSEEAEHVVTMLKQILVSRFAVDI